MNEECDRRGMFIKLNFSAPIDCRWVDPELKCTNTEEVFTLIKASTILAPELEGRPYG